jgi:hypothetical protein
VCAETDDPDGCRGNTLQIAAWWRRSVASNVAQDTLHRVMCSVLQWLMAKAIETASEGGEFVCHHQFVVLHNFN